MNCIRKATTADAVRIAQIHAKGWRDAYKSVMNSDFLRTQVEEERREHWEAHLRKTTSERVTLVLVEQGNVLGFVCFQLQKDSSWGAYIVCLFVDPGFRGQGRGKILIREAARWIWKHDSNSSVYLWVLECNSRAIKFYQRTGGQFVGCGICDLNSLNSAPAFRVHWHSATELLTTTN